MCKTSISLPTLANKDFLPLGTTTKDLVQSFLYSFRGRMQCTSKSQNAHPSKMAHRRLLGSQQAHKKDFS